MKVLIIYYSQSGNTQKIARAIRDGIKEDGHQVTVSALKNILYTHLDQYDLVGIGSPVWYADPPNIRKFVEEMPNQNGKHAFSFCTHGTMPNLYFPLVVPRLQKAGFQVIDWRGWYGDCSIQIFPSPYYTHGHPDDIDLFEAKSFGKKVCWISEEIKKGKTELIPKTPMPDMLSAHANAAIDHLGGFHNVHGKLVRDSSKCLFPKCTICMDNCTMNYIDLSINALKYGNLGDGCDDCHGCTYCEMICPTGAIHPEVPYEKVAPVGKDHGSELFCTVLKAAEQEGKFRRLIPYEQVGSTTPFYYTHSGHPRMRLLSTKEDN